MNTVTDLKVIGPSEPVPAPTIHILINRALSEGNLDVAERMLAMAARRAFNKAVAAAKAKIPVIVKTAQGHNNKYADMAAIARVVDPILSEFGLGYRFRTVQADGAISVTCVLFHDEGHSEETTLSAPSDSTTGKNAIQAIGSTLTYLQRYSLVQALGLAASKDDDGQAAGGNGATISALQLKELETLVSEVGADTDAFCKYCKVESLAAMPAVKFDRAKQALEAKRAPL